MRELVKLECMCAHHEKREPDCDTCRYLVQVEAEFTQLRGRRDQLIADLKRRVSSREIAIANFI